MANVLNEEKKQQVLALGRLGWSLRRIQQATHVRRETAGAYLKAAGIAVRPPSGWGRRGPITANEVITDFGAAKPGAHRVGDQPRPQCAGHLAGPGLRVRLRQQLPKRAALRAQAARNPNP